MCCLLAADWRGYEGDKVSVASTSTCRKHGRNLTSQVLGACEELFSNLRLELSKNTFAKLVFVFGPSIASPKEVYFVHLCRVSRIAEKENMQPVDYEALVRKVLRCLIVQSSDLYSSKELGNLPVYSSFSSML